MRYTHTFVAGVIIALATLSTLRAQGNEYAKLVASDGEAWAYFGISADTDGATVIVGASHTGETGAAYLFDAETGQQTARLAPSNAENVAQFGQAVSVHGNLAVVGASSPAGPFGDAYGSAYVFDALTGEEIARFEQDPPVGDSRFGGSVSVSGTIVAIGAYDDVVDGARRGAVYIFDSESGQQVRRLVADDGDADDSFGIAVALDGPLIVVGALGDDDVARDAGAAYVFDVVTGQQVAKLTASDGALQDFFGIAVAIEGTRVIVGTENHDANAENSGAAYVFDAASGAQIRKLLPELGERTDHFGYSVAVEGDRVLVGAHLDNDLGTDSGAAYLFDIDTGAQLRVLLPSDGDADDNFGQSAAMAAGIAVVGAHFDEPNGIKSGSAYLFAVQECRIDLNGDGEADTRDFIAFLNSWAAGEALADWNHDGAVDTRDVIAYLADWVEGC